MSNKVTINGKEYSYGEIVESEFFDNKSKEIVLNGEVVKVGDVWLTRELKEVVITNISIGRWPIKDNKERTYSVYGITDFSNKISEQDLMTKLKNDNTTVEDIKVNATEDTIEVNDTKEVNDANAAEEVNDANAAEEVTAATKPKAVQAIKDLPILDIQIGDVWKTASGNEVEIASHIPGTEFVWYTTCGSSYTDRGTYYSMMTGTKDLVQRISRNTELKAAELKEAPVLDMPSNYADALRHFNFENAVKMHMDSIVSLIGDRLCEQVKSRDVSAVKHLTKVLEKVIALESL